MYVLDVNHARAMALLQANQWNEHRTVDAYFSDPEGEHTSSCKE